MPSFGALAQALEPVDFIAVGPEDPAAAVDG